MHSEMAIVVILIPACQKLMVPCREHAPNKSANGLQSGR
jgi:hypothetical protein